MKNYKTYKKVLTQIIEKTIKDDASYKQNLLDFVAGIPEKEWYEEEDQYEAYLSFCSANFGLPEKCVNKKENPKAWALFIAGGEWKKYQEEHK